MDGHRAVPHTLHPTLTGVPSGPATVAAVDDAVTLDHIAAVLSGARALVARRGLSYETWFAPTGYDISACPVDPVYAIALSAAGGPHALGDDGWQLEESCVLCAVIAAATVAFARHVLHTELLVDDDDQVPALDPETALQALVSWLEADEPPVSDVVDALAATAADLRGGADAPGAGH